MGDEQKHSPIPWTVHTNMKPEMNGEAFIRCADEKDGILGEIVADVMNEDDAHFIAMAVKRRQTAVDAPNSTIRTILRRAYTQLNLCYHETADDEITMEVRDEIEQLLAKYGYSVD